MRVFSKLVLGFACSWLALFSESVLASERCEQLTMVSYPEQPPYVWQRGEDQPAQGAYVELAKRLAEDLGVAVNVLLEPNIGMARQEAVAGRVDILLADSVTLAGLEQLDYVYPAVHEQALVVWVAEPLLRQYQGWNDLRGKRGLMLPEQTLEPGFTQFAQANLSLQAAASLAQAVAALQEDKADFFIYGRLAGAAQLTGHGGVAAVTWPLSTQTQHLALSQSSACNSPWLRGQLALRMHEYESTGVWQRLQHEQLQQWLAQQEGAGASSQE